MLYPEIEPFDSGWLDVGDSHQIYWEQCGKPDGQPVLYLHGGPGGGCSPRARRLFNPQHYRIILFDQRGCGRSTPHASTVANDTENLLGDIEQLRKAMGVERWLLCGGSWGCTLALAYTQQHRERVTGMVLRSVFTGRAQELEWLYRPEGAAKVFPQAWDEFAAAACEQVSGSLLPIYATLLNDQNTETQMKTALAWCRWERAILSFDADQAPASEDPLQCLAMARISAHIFSHDKSLGTPGFIWPADYLKDLPGIIVQGRYDMVTPVATAWELHQQWPRSSLRIVSDAGHSSSDPALLKAWMRALEEMETL